MPAAEPGAIGEVDRTVAETEARCPQPLTFAISIARQGTADRMTERGISYKPRSVRPGFAETLGRMAMYPVAGIAMLLAVLCAGLRLMVGRVGAGVAVDFLDEQLFARYVNPAATSLMNDLLPRPAWSALFVRDYAITTMGLRYALAIVLPPAGAFFLAFAVVEDTGHLPRLALLARRLFKRFGLSGRAVIPIVLGPRCDTMATLVTRIIVNAQGACHCRLPPGSRDSLLRTARRHPRTFLRSSCGPRYLGRGRARRPPIVWCSRCSHPARRASALLPRNPAPPPPLPA